MKDELNGGVDGYFLGIKQYGYWYLDNNGNRIDKSVFVGAGREKNK